MHILQELPVKAHELLQGYTAIESSKESTLWANKKSWKITLGDRVISSGFCLEQGKKHFSVVRLSRKKGGQII